MSLNSSLPTVQRHLGTLRTIAAITATAILTTGCDNDDDAPLAAPNTEDISMTFTGLEDLGSDYVYDGGIRDMDGNVVSAGRFSIDGDGNPVPA